MEDLSLDEDREEAVVFIVHPFRRFSHRKRPLTKVDDITELSTKAKSTGKKDQKHGTKHLSKANYCTA